MRLRCTSAFAGHVRRATIHPMADDEVLRRIDAHMAREMRALRREFVEESRAQRAALFRMFDRLDGGADPAGA
jgi:hypothetical protein